MRINDQRASAQSAGALCPARTISLDGVGCSLKPAHYQTILERDAKVDFFEIHAENYMHDGGAHWQYLDQISEKHAISLHGVGLSLGSADGLDPFHLERFRTVFERTRPALVSEHLAWSVSGGVYLNDLLPLPLTRESLAIVTDNVKRVQDKIGVAILVENPSLYVGFSHSEIPETDFLSYLADRSGCGLLLDINNVVVSASNLGFDARDYLHAFDVDRVGEIHLAGHVTRSVDGAIVKIDDHGSHVSDEVLDLYADVVAKSGTRPTLIEWDANIPAFPVFEQQIGIIRDCISRRGIGTVNGV